MGLESHNENPLKIIFLPFPQPGHMLPMADLAKTLASNGVECITITTPLNAPLFESSNNPYMKVLTLSLPTPLSVEDFGKATSPELRRNLFQAISMLREPTQQLIRELLPVDCIVSDMFYPWTSDFAVKIGVPRLLSHGSVFNQCCALSVMRHAQHELVESDDGLVTLTSLPDKIVMRKSQIPKWVRVPGPFTRMTEAIREAELKCYGSLANTVFCEKEKEYFEYYTKVTGVKVWNVGLLCLRVNREKEVRRQCADGDNDDDNCLRWLDQKEPKSVLYVSFGSMTRFPDAQLREIAAGLEASGHDFIWALKKREGAHDEGDWSIEEYKKRMGQRGSNKGLVVQGWAPQMGILEHKSIGGMVTHCGWNTILEGVSIGGVPFVTWPLFAEQFYNERFLVDVLKIGVAVGVTIWCNMDEPAEEEVIGREKVEAAVRALMGEDDDAVEMRHRAEELREVALRAVQDGGESQANLVAFMDDLKTMRLNREAAA